jgi:excisionase family DNA binding protein
MPTSRSKSKLSVSPIAAAAPAWVTDATAHLPPLLRINEVGAALRTHVRTVRRLIAAGRIRALRSREAGSSRVLVPRAEVARYLQSLAGGAL